MKILLLLPLLLIGCASQQEISTLSAASMEVARQQAIAAQARPSTLTIDCSQGGCGNAIVKYTDPRDIQQVTGLNITGTNDVLKAGVQPLADVLTIGVIGVTAGRVIKSIAENGGTGNSNTRNTTIVNGDSNTTTPTSSNTDNTGVNNSTSDRHDAVSTPTVVTQPVPTVVRPEVVQPTVIEK